MDSDFCQDRIVQIGIVPCLLKLIMDAKWGKNVTFNGLDAIDELLEQYDCYQDKKSQVLNMFQNTLYDLQDTGIEIIEQLIFDENEEVRDKALEVLSKHFEYDSQFFMQDDNDTVLHDIYKADGKQEQ